MFFTPSLEWEIPNCIAHGLIVQASTVVDRIKIEDFSSTRGEQITLGLVLKKSLSHSHLRISTVYDFPKPLYPYILSGPYLK